MIQLKRDAIEAGGQSEDTVDDVLELEVGAQLFFVEVVLGLAKAFGIVGKVPGHEFKGLALFLAGFLTDGFHIAFCCGKVAVKQFVVQVVDVLDILGHTFLEDVVGKILVAQQLCDAQSEVDDLPY